MRGFDGDGEAVRKAANDPLSRGVRLLRNGIYTPRDLYVSRRRFLQDPDLFHSPGNNVVNNDVSRTGPEIGDLI